MAAKKKESPKKESVTVHVVSKKVINLPKSVKRILISTPNKDKRSVIKKIYVDMYKNQVKVSVRNNDKDE